MLKKSCLEPKPATMQRVTPTSLKSQCLMSRLEIKYQSVSCTCRMGLRPQPKGQTEMLLQTFAVSSPIVSLAIMHNRLSRGIKNLIGHRTDRKFKSQWSL